MSPRRGCAAAHAATLACYIPAVAFARLIVEGGPDQGRSFEVPMRGGLIGRADDALVPLTDPTVSRVHARLEFRGGAMALVVDEPGPRTLVNGEVVTHRALAHGDELSIGASRLRYLVEVPSTSRTAGVTLDVASRQLVALATTPAAAQGDGRAARYLAALAGFGDGLAELAGSDAVARAACVAARDALGAERAFVLRGGGALAVQAAAVPAHDPGGGRLDVPPAVRERVIAQGSALALAPGGDGGPRAVIAVPVPGPTPGMLWLDRPPGLTDWDALDAMAAAVIGNLVGAALVGAAAHDELVRGKAAVEDRLEQHGGSAGFIGTSDAARRVLDFVARVGPADATVLLGGESGAGKEMVAQAIHQASRRARGPLVAVNCAALTESLIESELFGHERGAFTGATDRKAGRFELADRGTLFLDEVGELPMNLQTKFLRVLEDRRVDRIGAARSIDVDVRVIAASNRDLAEHVRRGLFREDLYYRLSVITIAVPPLRDRADDVPLLAEHFLARFRGQAGRRIRGFSPAATARMIAHPWPGNVRELRNAVERAVVLGASEWIEPDDLPDTINAAPARPRTPTPPMGSMTSAAPLIATATATPHARALRELERDGIVAALAATGGNKARAASILEIDRSTLYKKLKDYGLE